MFDNQRPGVYSRVELSGQMAGDGSCAALLLPSQGGQEVSARVESYHDGLSLLAGNNLALDCLRLLFGGSGEVIVVVAPGFAQALEALGGFGEVRAIVSGFAETQDLAALRSFAESSAQGQRECVVFAGIDAPQAAISAAQSLNSGRVVLCCPAISLEEEEEAHPIYGACALAAAVVGASSPIRNFNGETFPALHHAPLMPEDAVQSLLKAGVSVFENVGARVELIRALTTNGGNLRSLNTVLIIDYVMRSVRQSLRVKLSAGRATIEGVRDLVAVELASKRDAGIITTFAPPRCRPDKNDPGICVVEISFGVAHLLSKIHLTAHIRV